MKKFISFITTTLTLLALLTLFVFVFIFILTKTSNGSVKNVITYTQSLGDEIKDSIVQTTTQKEIITLSEEENNMVIEDINVNNYYFQQLDDNSKIIYSALENNIANLKKDNYSIDFSKTFNELLHKSDGQYTLNKSFQSALDAFFYDHPELFYIDLTKISLIINYTTIGPKTTYKVSIAPKNKNSLYSYFKSEEEINVAISKVENIRKNLVSSVANYDDYTKALKVHDTLINSIKYSSSKIRHNNHNIYGALVDKEVVCEGYAKAFKYILDGLNIECILVNGKAVNSSNKSEAHMWNYIKLNNNWYGVDATWDDPVFINNPSKNVIRHNYFCKGNTVFIESHFPSGKISDKGMRFALPTLSYNNYK